MEIIDTIKSWSIQKKIFVGLLSATIIVGTTYSAIKAKEYIVSHKPIKNKK